MTAHLSHESAFPDYWEEALLYLSERDPVMSRLIERYRHIEFSAHESVIASILRAIVGQQISNKAAATLWMRLCRLVGILSLWSRRSMRCEVLALILEKSRR